MLNNSLSKSLILSLVCIAVPYSIIRADNPSESSSSQAPSESSSSQTPSESSFSQARCDDRCQSSRITARHIENKGIGYNTGYTTLEAFLAAPVDSWTVMPFIDLRGHIFNNGHWAANGGLGLRSLMNGRIYGVYAYYDYRDTKRKGYNQVSFGVETLGTLWDLRLNGYAVVGDRKSHPYSTKFNRFSGNNIYYSQKFQYALSGGNAEVGFYPLKMQDTTLYTGIGPYYLKGPVGGAVWGGQARVKAMWKDYIGVEVSYSYDHTFKNIVQGQVFLSLPFGPKRTIREIKTRSCMDNFLLCQRMIEPVAKSEIIPVTSKKNKRLAINPVTGQPYTVWFVNNLSHSAGTYESPFSILADAENASKANDLIYVYPGDLTSTGLSDGITLKNGQQLLGATIKHRLKINGGKIILPAQASGNNPPLLTNGAGNVVTLANNNVVSGFYIQNTAGAGVMASGSRNATLTQNYIQGNSSSYNGVELDNVTGTVTVSSNTIMYQTMCVNIDNSNPISNASYLFYNNTLQLFDNTNGFNIAYTEGSNNYFLSENNNIYGSDAAAINIFCSNTTTNAPHVFDITNCNIGTYDNYAMQLTLTNDSIAQLNIENSKINSYYGVYIITNNQSQLTSSITNNLFNGYEYPIYTETYDTSRLAVDISENTINSYDYSIYTFLSGSADITGSITNNTINTLYNGIYIDSLDNSNVAVDINDNTFSSAYYHLEIVTDDSSSYSGSITGNTFIGEDNDDIFYWFINTSGNVSSTISNNFFTGASKAIDLSNFGTGISTIAILDNTVQNSSNAPGIAVNNSGTNLQATVSDNTFQGFIMNAVGIFNFAAGEMCLKFNNNTSNPYPNAYLINNTNGILNLVTPTGNLGQLQITGTTPVTPVSECP